MGGAHAGRGDVGATGPRALQALEEKGVTPVWKIDPARPEAAVAAPVAVIRGGGIVVYPTETFYGLGGDPFNIRTVERVYRVKGRNFIKPLPLIAADVESARRSTASWPETAQRLATAFWPGPLTLALPAAPGLPPALHAGTGRTAVRVSSHPVAQALAAAAGGLLISTSANFAGEPAQADPESIAGALAGETDGLVDAGLLPGGAPSTIVDLSGETPRLIRMGCIPWVAVAAILDGDSGRYRPGEFIHNPLI